MKLHTLIDKIENVVFLKILTLDFIVTRSKAV